MAVCVPLWRACEWSLICVTHKTADKMHAHAIKLEAMRSAPRITLLQFIKSSWREIIGNRYDKEGLYIIKFGEHLLWISLKIIDALSSYIKHSKKCFIRCPNTSKLLKKKKTRLPLVFSTYFSVWLDIVIWYSHAFSLAHSSKFSRMSSKSIFAALKESRQISPLARHSK